ncbi:energy transducer TonB [Larkinella rosea]|uniref:TonB family protein n=1 Tax=Larkinella rosea TaxID=2025312 RepID=A0A3P1BDQ7_9BACT|nr:energy transducer TonB [Larkinella rosea]RRA99184.1 TonB family protein [Larkinella rosea]
MTEPNQHNDHLTAEDLRNYRDKALSAAEQHRVERLLLENPLYAEALEGLEASGQNPAELNRISGELHERLQNRVADKKVKRLPIWIPAAAASVVLVLSIGLYVKMQERSEQPERMVSAPAPQISAQKDAVLAEKPVENPIVEEALPAQPAKPQPPLLARSAEPVLPNNKPVPARDSLIIPKDNLLAVSPAPAPAASHPQSFEVPGDRMRSVKIVDQPVRGRVFDEEKRPLPGVLVRAKNTDQQVVTDSSGRFRLNRVRKTDTLQLVSIGYLQQEILAGHSRTDSIQLKPDTQALSEVVVVGYGAQAKKYAAGSRTRMAPAKTALTSAPSAPANFKSYLDENRRMPPEAKEKGISGTVRVRFLVAPDGSVSQFSIIKSLGYGCDEEAIRLIREGPRWKPLIRNGQPVAQFAEQDMVF